ncbi:MAG: phosphoenolpyruvate carboxykinase (ATP) [Armatimonadetes bacterium]|nr:phosphoenolpyruvate carboxykinase (ATP) [Armatimonadota bacterium]
MKQSLQSSSPVRTTTSIAKLVSHEIQEKAGSENRLTTDIKKILDLALKDETTCKALGITDVRTKHGSLAWTSRITNRSARFTQVFFGSPDPEQTRTIEGVREFVLSSQVQLLSLDKRMGLHPEHSHHCRTIVTSGFARLLAMWDKLIFDIPSEWKGKEPDQIVIYIPEWAEFAKKKDLPEKRILVDADNRVTFVLGSDYFGEVKKGHLRMAMYHEKLAMNAGKGGGLGVHAGGKVIRALDAATHKVEEKGALFFGLSGTGKTSLSVHHYWLDPKEAEAVIIRQDDFFVLSGDGKAYGTEDNAYIKTEGLEPEGQPLLYKGATSSQAILENVYMDPRTREINFSKYDHPFALGGQCLNGRGIVVRRDLPQTDDKIDLDHVDYIFFITRKDTIVPPVARLNSEQAAANFMLGESIITSAADPARAGESVREVGTNPFIVGSEGEEGNLFLSILRKNSGIQCFLLNTGSFGGHAVVRKAGTLADRELLEGVRLYAGGKASPLVGAPYVYEGVPGKPHSYKIKLVRYEVEYAGELIKTPKEIGEFLVRVNEGKIEGARVSVREVVFLEGEKIRIQDSCALIREVARGRIEWKEDPDWKYEVPASVPDFSLDRFDPLRYYTPEEYKRLNTELRKERIAWLSRFPELRPEIARAVQ